MKILKDNQINACFRKTTKHDFRKHIYGKISRCCFRNNILYFFSSEKEATGFCVFFFSHNKRYYKALRDVNLTNTILEQQIKDFLYPDDLTELGMQIMY